MAMMISEEWKPYKYIITIGIDFGSTNTVLAFNFRKFDGREYVLENGSVRRIPSMFILKSDNKENNSLRYKKDMFGKDAERFLNDKNYNEPPIIRSNYKQDLYDYAPGSEEKKRALENTLLLFGYLKEECEKELRKNFRQFRSPECGVFCYLSTPVRAEFDKLDEMRELCKKAGFTRENGFTAIKTDNGTLNEAICAVRYLTQNFLGEKKLVIEGEGMTKIIKEVASKINIPFLGKLQKQNTEDENNIWKTLSAKAKSGRDVYILFGDLGGSTFDLCLVIWNEDPKVNGGKVIRPVSFWPHAGEKNSLGSSDIDKALRDYFVSCGLADREYTTKKWEEGIGKKKFRVFKEICNERFHEEPNAVIEKTGELRGACVEVGKDFLYVKSNHKITKEVFENQICGDYIDRICMAVNTLFQEQNKIKKEDVDVVLLSGAGSNLYFLKDVFLGKLGGADQRILLKKVRENPSRVYHRIMNPSECCALGALMEPGIEVGCISREEYWCNIRIYRMETALWNYLRENPHQDVKLLKIPGQHTVTIGKKNKKGNMEYYSYDYNCLSCRNYKVVGRNQTLPVERKIEYILTDKVKYWNDFDAEYVIQFVAYRREGGVPVGTIKRIRIPETFMSTAMKVLDVASGVGFWAKTIINKEKEYKLKMKYTSTVKEDSIINLDLEIYATSHKDTTIHEKFQF